MLTLLTAFAPKQMLIHKTILNPNEMLLYKDPYGEYPGRFELYPTKNVYNFIMLDTATGSTWQVQWSQDNNQAIIEIL